MIRSSDAYLVICMPAWHDRQADMVRPAETSGQYETKQQLPVKHCSNTDLHQVMTDKEAQGWADLSKRGRSSGYSCQGGEEAAGGVPQLCLHHLHGLLVVKGGNLVLQLLQLLQIIWRSDIRAGRHCLQCLTMLSLDDTRRAIRKC